MKPRLHLIQAIGSENVNYGLELLSLGANTNDYIDGMSPV